MRLEELLLRLLGRPCLPVFLAIFSIATSQTSTDCEFSSSMDKTFSCIMSWLKIKAQ